MAAVFLVTKQTVTVYNVNSIEYYTQHIVTCKPGL